MIAEETLKAQIARMIYEARTAAGLSQRALAARIDTKPSLIARLEDADVDSDALFLLHRICGGPGACTGHSSGPRTRAAAVRISRALAVAAGLLFDSSVPL